MTTRRSAFRPFWAFPVAAALLVAAALGAPVAADDAGQVTVRPGHLVAWSAPGTVRCGAAGETWEPQGATCWYPVDLLREGTSTVTRSVGEGTARRQDTLRVVIGDYPYPEQRLTVEPGQVNLSDADGARAARERKRIDALWELRTPRRFELPLATPLAEMTRGGRFGSRRFFNGEPRSPHTGADYAVPTGTPVRAVAPGVVMLAEDHFFGGNSVFIDHGDGLISMSLHLSKIAVEEGQKVDTGDVVGQVGATGRATGPHLHFGFRWRGERVDPELLFHSDRAQRVGN